MPQKVILVSLGLLLTGCAYRSGHEFHVSDIEKIEKGKTTKQEIVQTFGQPQFTSNSSSGETWIYQHTDLGYVTPIGAVGKNIQQDMLSITFNGNVVKDFSWSASRATGVSKNPLGI